MRRIAAAVVAAVLLGGSTVAVAQWGWRRMPPRYPSAEPTHRLFTFARGFYQSTHRERGGQGWHTDYPDADINFSIRLSELTHAPVGVDGALTQGDGDLAAGFQQRDELTKCPFTVAWRHEHPNGVHKDEVE